MSENFKIGDEVFYNNKLKSLNWENSKGVSLYNKNAKILYIKDGNTIILIEFKKFINNNRCSIPQFIKGKKGYCFWVYKKNITSLNQLKLKKFIERGV